MLSPCRFLSLAGELYCQQILAYNPFSPRGTFPGAGLKQDGMESSNILTRGTCASFVFSSACHWWSHGASREGTCSVSHSLLHVEQDLVPPAWRFFLGHAASFLLVYKQCGLARHVCKQKCAVCLWWTGTPSFSSSQKGNVGSFAGAHLSLSA